MKLSLYRHHKGACVCESHSHINMTHKQHTPHLHTRTRTPAVLQDARACESRGKKLHWGPSPLRRRAGVSSQAEREPGQPASVES